NDIFLWLGAREACDPRPRPGETYADLRDKRHREMAIQPIQTDRNRDRAHRVRYGPASANRAPCAACPGAWQSSSRSFRARRIVWLEVVAQFQHRKESRHLRLWPE